jgi:ribosome biogenesis GTPase A
MSSNEAVYIDEVIDRAIKLCNNLPLHYQNFRAVMEECKDRLSSGALRLAVMGMFKRGKSSFINTLLGMDILPTSVIPVTSIPTTITYGKTLRCIIRFYNKKPDLVVQESAGRISLCLLEHVAEENNPQNRLCVSEAVVECPNSLLENGTVLIDTPGFGSTYIHNTKTTLDLLTQCDAVLFLLSADPPFTQTEVEFLKEVKKAIPRIFFILNKIDLLTVDELEKIDTFLKGVLSKNLDFPVDTNIFHISAKIGQTLKNLPENNPAWRVSGISSIKTGIIDFMVREKYFTLSQAISDRFKGAVSDVLARLDVDYKELAAPVDEARKEYEWIIHHSGSIQKKIDRERGMIDVELKAFSDFVDKTIDTQKGDLQQKAATALQTVLAGVLLRKSSLAHTVHAAFEQHASALFDHLFLQITDAVNKPLNKAILLHINEFVKLHEEIKKSAPSASISVNKIEALCDDIEIHSDPQWSIEGVAVAFQQIKLPYCGIFASDKTRRKRYQECFTMAITEIINRNIIRLSLHVKELINISYKEFKHGLDSGFDELMAAMGIVMEEKKKIIDNFESEIKDRLAEIENRKNAFKKIIELM